VTCSENYDLKLVFEIKKQGACSVPNNM